jgi:hypothetical protein
VNESSKVALAAKFKSKGRKQREENNGKSSELGKYRKAIKCLYCGKLGHMCKICRKQLWDEKHSQEHSLMINPKRKTIMSLNKRRKSSMFSWLETNTRRDKDDGYVDSGASKHFTNSIDWYANFVEDKFPSESAGLGGGKEYRVRGKGNVLLQLRGKKVTIKYVYCVPCLEIKPLPISSTRKFSAHLHINFNDNRCFIVDKNNKKMVAMGVEERGLFQLIEIDKAKLVQQKDDFNLIKNSATIPRQ